MRYYLFQRSLGIVADGQELNLVEMGHIEFHDTHHGFGVGALFPFEQLDPGAEFLGKAGQDRGWPGMKPGDIGDDDAEQAAVVGGAPRAAGGCFPAGVTILGKDYRLNVRTRTADPQKPA